MKEMFFCKIKRREIEYYYNRDRVFYSDYGANYAKVADDCYHRCVYCDVSEKECGGERFSLDHFRPQKIFKIKFDGILCVHPYNLLLSCQRCNVLKSDDWKGCTEDIDGASHINGLGFIDRTKDDFYDYMSIDSDGRVHSINKNGPGEYMIKKLLLNRTNRLYLRKKRVVDIHIKNTFDRLGSFMKNIVSNQESMGGEGTLSMKLKEIIELHDKFKSVL